MSKKFSHEEMSNLFYAIEEATGCNEKTLIEITNSECSASDEKELEDIIGYKVKYKSKGFHKNDGQMVDYKFTFISPSGEKTIVWTDMCLMIGWNHCHDEEIK